MRYEKYERRLKKDDRTFKFGELLSFHPDYESSVDNTQKTILKRVVF
jgi:hypothetical protein